jgi:membrane-bound lytic murein transglycosylase B
VLTVHPSTVITTTTTTAPPPATTTSTTAAALQPQPVPAATSKDELIARFKMAKPGPEQQLAYRQLVVHPDWFDAAVAAVPESKRAEVQANIKAEVELAALAPKNITKLPAWHIVAPPPAEELLADYRAADKAIGVPWQYLAAINFIESRMGRIRGNSTAGAQGPMQFLPATWSQYGNGGDIQNPKDAVFAAARLLKHNGAPDNMDNALFNYNRSPHYVAAVTAYAQVMAADESAYLGYHDWQVYYRLATGDVILPEGWQGP